MKGISHGWALIEDRVLRFEDDDRLLIFNTRKTAREQARGSERVTRVEILWEDGK